MLHVCCCVPGGTLPQWFNLLAVHTDGLVCVRLQVVLKAPEQLATFLDLSGFSLGAAIRHGIDVMLPLFASYLPGLWQLSMDALTSGCKLITSSKACAACAATLPGQQAAAPRQQQQGSHTGPGVGAVLHALLDVLPAMWQSYQALITQRCEQRQLYLDAADDEEESLTPLSIDGTPRQGPGSAKSAVAAELHRQSSWLVQLLVLGRHMHSNGRSSPAEGCPCIRESVADRRLRLAWRACLEDVVKATRSALPKVRCSCNETRVLLGLGICGSMSTRQACCTCVSEQPLMA